MRAILIAVASLFFAPFASAAVVVIANTTNQPVECTVALGTAAPQPVKLAPGESKPIVCGRTIEVSYESLDGKKRMKLEPYNAYYFRDPSTAKKKAGIELMAIELLGKPLDPKDVPELIPTAKPLKVPVKIFVDDAERRTPAIWNATLKKRLAQANEIMLRDAGITFDLVDTDDWTVDPAAADLRATLANFEKQVNPAPATIAIGYTSRTFAPPMAKGVVPDLPFATSRGMFAPNILIREGDPRTEPERVEVLVQLLGRWLGAITSPDPFSVMRAKLGDSKAVQVRFRVGFDPLNELAISIVAEELRNGLPKKIADWPAVSQLRLARVYATLNLAMPEEPLSEEVAGLLDRVGQKIAAVPDAKPMKEVADAPRPKAERNVTAEQEAIRKVMKAITVKAEENAAKPANARVKGDDLTELYIRAAADVAYTLEENLRKKAFLVGIGMALDDSELVRKNIVYGSFWKACESDDERKVRIAVLGNPTVRFRRDLCQHFSLSAALTAIDGPAKAEAIGLAKEVMDMEQVNGSGFDFSDLVGDFAGVELANYVLASGEKLNVLRQKFAVADYVPKVEDLADGLSKAKFAAKYGSTDDPRFNAAVDAVRKRVKDMPIYRKRIEN